MRYLKYRLQNPVNLVLLNTSSTSGLSTAFLNLLLWFFAVSLCQCLSFSGCETDMTGLTTVTVRNSRTRHRFSSEEKAGKSDSGRPSSVGETPKVSKTLHSYNGKIPPSYLDQRIHHQHLEQQQQQYLQLHQQRNR